MAPEQSIVNDGVRGREEGKWRDRKFADEACAFDDSPCIVGNMGSGCYAVTIESRAPGGEVFGGVLAALWSPPEPQMRLLSLLAL